LKPRKTKKKKKKKHNQNNSEDEKQSHLNVIFDKINKLV